MNVDMRQLLTLMLVLISMNMKAQNSQLIISPIPEGVERNGDFIVKARTEGGEWQDVGTYDFRVAKNDNGRAHTAHTSVAKLDFTGRIEVSVTCQYADIDSFSIRPLSYNIQGKKQERTITFTLDRPRYLSVEVNGDRFRNLQLFADAPAPQKPKRKKVKDLIYFGPGIHDLKGDSVIVPSGSTVYIDGGAYVKGWLSVRNASDVRIIGHGILMPGGKEGIKVSNSRRVVIDGPVTTKIPVGGSDSIDVRNAKVMSWFPWGDGMNVFASSNLRYQHVFCRTSDDCSTIYCTRLGYAGSCHNISVQDAVYWADVAHPIMIGLHGDISKNEVIEDVHYEDIDIIGHTEYQVDYQGCIAINNGDNITVRRCTFNNFRIEDIRNGMLFNFRVCFNKKYCKAPGRGIEDVTLSNISYCGTSPNMSVVVGYDKERQIRNVQFKNLSINGRIISDDMQGKLAWYKTSDYANIFLGEHVSDVLFSR